MRRGFLTLLIGLGIGLLGGALLGWWQQGLSARAGIDQLHPEYKADYAVMVGAAYSVNGDWDLAQARLGRLAKPDPASYIVLTAERYLYDARNPEDVRNLVTLAARYGYITPRLQYLAPTTAP